MDNQKQQLVDSLKQATNILVTVSSNPSVDQLSACIGLTLALNKMGKHATAVFSGQIPNTIEFLQPEKTIEKNTDSLRDFIIALDKSKADKLRYKVEDKVVKIFITPYKTSISDKDLEFSQGDFNVDVVVALGVQNQGDLDQAITAHGRILHDAVVATLNVKPGGELGTLNWLDPQLSSLSEMVVQLIDATDKTMMDGQMATALLTGIVAETERFGNSRTSPQTMSMSAELMAAGANQQLVVTKLEEAKPKPQAQASEPVSIQAPVAVATSPSAKSGGLIQAAVPAKKEEGTLEISHPLPDLSSSSADAEAEAEKPPEKEDETPQIDIDHEGTLRSLQELADKKSKETPPSEHQSGPRMILQPPTMGGQLTANASPPTDGVPDPLSLPSPTDEGDQILERPSGAPPLKPSDGGFATLTPSSGVAPPPATPPLPPLDDFSQPATPADATAVGLPPLTPPVSNDPSFGQPAQTADPSVDSGGHLTNARDAVHQAINSQPSGRPQEPIVALNAQPLGTDLHPPVAPMPDLSQMPAQPFTGQQVDDPNAPPPVPPPMMPPAPQ